MATDWKLWDEICWSEDDWIEWAPYITILPPILATAGGGMESWEVVITAVATAFLSTLISTCILFRKLYYLKLPNPNVVLDNNDKKHLKTGFFLIGEITLTLAAGTTVQPKDEKYFGWCSVGIIVFYLIVISFLYMFRLKMKSSYERERAARIRRIERQRGNYYHS